MLPSEAFFMAAYDAGARGMICGMANVFPEVLAEMHQAYLEGDRKQAMEVQRLVLRIRAIAKTGPTVPILHEIIKMRGVDAGYSRSQLTEIDPAMREKITSDFKKLGLL